MEVDHDKDEKHTHKVCTKGKALGDIRLKLRYTEGKILHEADYHDLVDLINERELVVIQTLGEITTEKEAIAASLVRIAQHYNTALILLDQLICFEVDNTPNSAVMFRGNSLATKAVDFYMKLIGMNYLHKTLASLIKEATQSGKNCEVDPTRLEKGDSERNMQHLRTVVQHFMNAIFNSLEDCPYEFHLLFQQLQSKVIDKYGAGGLERYTSVSGFLFLRFWAPAILNPMLFQLCHEHPDKKASRNLTLVAKVIQNLGNLVEFGGKEPYMQGMNSFILENMNAMKKFIDDVATIPSTTKQVRQEYAYVDATKELAYISNHLVKNRDKISEHPNGKKPQIQQLGKILDAILAAEKNEDAM